MLIDYVNIGTLGVQEHMMVFKIGKKCKKALVGLKSVVSTATSLFQQHRWPRQKHSSREMKCNSSPPLWILAIPSLLLQATG